MTVLVHMLTFASTLGAVSASLRMVQKSFGDTSICLGRHPNTLVSLFLYAYMKAQVITAKDALYMYYA